MFSAPSAGLISSAGLGLLVGLVDAISFLFVVRLIFSSRAGAGKTGIAVGVEIAKLTVLVAVVVFAVRQWHLSAVWLVATALLVSLLGKSLLIFRK